MRQHLIGLILVALSVSGCAYDMQVNASRPSYVEYVDDSGHVRIIVIESGAARIDFWKQGKGTREDLRTIAIPADPEEVLRISRCLSALIDARFAEQTPRDRSRAIGAPIVVLRWRHAGQDKMIELPLAQVHSNLIWNGIIEEFFAVTSLSLGQAIQEAEIAEAALAMGDSDKASAAYNRAVDLITKWHRERSTRHGYLWEFRREYRAPIGQVVLTGNNILPQLLEVDGITPETAADLLQHMYQDMLNSVASVSETDLLKHIAFKAEADEFRMWDTPISEISPKDLEYLKHSAIGRSPTN